MMAGPAIASPAIAGLVLAAGESSRMRRDKALLPYRGHTFLETIVDKLWRAGISRVAVVLGHHADQIRCAVSLPGVEVVTNCDYLRGQTSSMQAGLAALGRLSRSGPQELGLGLAGTTLHPRHFPKGEGRIILSTEGAYSDERPKSLDAFFLCLVDHPAFEPSTLTALVEAFTRTRAPLIIPTQTGRRGHPVLIARPLFGPLLDLPPDQAANSVIREWHSRAHFVEVTDPGILMDVDDPETYSALEPNGAALLDSDRT